MMAKQVSPAPSGRPSLVVQEGVRSPQLPTPSCTIDNTSYAGAWRDMLALGTIKAVEHGRNISMNNVKQRVGYSAENWSKFQSATSALSHGKVQPMKYSSWFSRLWGAK
jgi:hypothetical protein